MRLRAPGACIAAHRRLDSKAAINLPRMRERIRPVAEIEEIERAYHQSVPALGHAASEWLRRWRLPLRDDGTFLRLAFLCWCRKHEPTWLTGLDAELPGVDELIAEAGGEAALSGEALFALAILWNLFAPLGADEVESQERARTLAQRASTLEPQSHLFRERRYFRGEAADTIEPRINLRSEVHARYHDRGAMGDYLVHTLLDRPFSRCAHRPCAG